MHRTSRAVVAALALTVSLSGCSLAPLLSQPRAAAQPRDDGVTAPSLQEREGASATSVPSDLPPRDAATPAPRGSTGVDAPSDSARDSDLEGAEPDAGQAHSAAEEQSATQMSYFNEVIPTRDGLTVTAQAPKLYKPGERVLGIELPTHLGSKEPLTVFAVRIDNVSARPLSVMDLDAAVILNGTAQQKVEWAQFELRTKKKSEVEAAVLGPGGSVVIVFVVKGRPYSDWSVAVLRTIQGRADRRILAAFQGPLSGASAHLHGRRASQGLSDAPPLRVTESQRRRPAAG